MPNLNAGSVTWNLDVDSKKFDKGLANARTEVDTTAKTIEKKSSSIGKTVGIALAGSFAAATAAVGAFSVSGVKLAGNLEAARMGFIALLGSADKADATIARITKEAAATPFELPGLIEGTQALAAITKDGNKAVDVLLDVGKAIATSGKGQAELDRVILNLQQIASTGKVTAMDIRQFQGSIPIFNDILKASGLTAASLQDSSDAATLLFKAFKKAGEEGGLTAQGFSLQAGTFNQVMSNLSDTIGIAAMQFVQATGIFDLTKEAVARLTASIPTLVAYVTTLIASIKTLINWFENSTAGIQSFISAIWPYLSAFFEFVINTIIDNAKVLYEQLKPAWEELKQALIPLMPVIKGIALVLAATLGGAIIVLIPLIKSLLVGVVTVFTGIVKVISGAVQIIKGIFGVISGIIYGLVTGDFYVLQTGWRDLWNGISSFTSGILQTIRAPFTAFIDFILGLFRLLPENIRNAVSGVGSAILKPFTDARDSIYGVVDTIKGQLDKINPFHRESPSLVDNVKKGVGVIADEFASLAGINVSAPVVATAGYGGSKSVTINNNNYLSRESDVGALSKQMSFLAETL